MMYGHNGLSDRVHAHHLRKRSGPDICTGLQHLRYQPNVLSIFSRLSRLLITWYLPSVLSSAFDPLTPAHAKSIVRRGSSLGTFSAFLPLSPDESSEYTHVAADFFRS